ncbi:MazG-like nucleotide pyrophosphohydrolase [Microbacterium phage Pumpernickel]|uniref:MazG-like nucleotide pyrophosphohydrolase n=1 Tax=Microbacterium phage Pumpernickel TaxID=2885983 RepID=A0AAE9C3F9_9CAUD|nr:MazG-like nucleotide pyrophosphohydrolase [Microbacterium phage Pumpernickel]UDL15911.1 MazG-like nucleotide pyrophosphohydrolase [Microbacterium phage Pumpernickel]
MTKTLSELIRLAGETNEKNGYNGYAQANADGYGVDYLAKKDLLEVSELTEALDELRHGHSPAEIYLSWPPTPPSLAAEFPSGAEATAHFRANTPGKPEGYLIEKLDAVIRALGTIYEVADVHGLDIEVIEEHLVGKIEYNAQRADTKNSGVKNF